MTQLRPAADLRSLRRLAPRRHTVFRAFREHWLFIGVLVVGVVVRVLMMVAYPPALFFNDSWGYLFTAFTGHPVALSYLHPNGYPILIHLLTLPGRDLVQLVAVQHLSGVVAGCLIYVAILRAGAPRLLAAIAAALVLADGYVITLEQYLMPEAFFILTLLAAALMVTWPRLEPVKARRQPRVRSVAVAGLLLAAAAIQREAALFAAPVFVLYLLWCRLHLRALASFLLALALPVLAYAALYDIKMGVFGLSETSGWTLYGRVAGFADCTGAGIPRAQQALCETRRQRASHPDSPDYYIWDGTSPAARMFPNGHQTRQLQRRSDAVLGSFARRIIINQPLDYAQAVGADFLRYFTPGATPFNDASSATSLPSRAAAQPRNDRENHRVLPGVHPAVRTPAGFLRAYRRVLHLPRPLLAVLALASVLAVAMRLPRRKEVLLLSGSALALLLGTSATGGFGFRYLLPTVPLLAIGGALALDDLGPLVFRHRRATPSSHTIDATSDNAERPDRVVFAEDPPVHR
jgi:hypothetical protein